MSLSNSFGLLQGNLAYVNRGIGITSENVVHESDQFYVRRDIAGIGSQIRKPITVRSSDFELAQKCDIESSKYSYLETQEKRLLVLSEELGESSIENGLPFILQEVESTLGAFADDSANITLAGSVTASLGAVIDKIRYTYKTISEMILDISGRIEAAVQEANSILEELSTTNQVLPSNQNENAVYQNNDDRDRLLRNLSNLIPISTEFDANMRIRVSTLGGIPLLDEKARELRALIEPSYSASNDTAILLADGLSMNHFGMSEAARTGEILGLIHLRDRVLIDARSKLDGIAFALVSIFSEARRTDISGETRKPGLVSLDDSSSSVSDLEMFGVADRVKVSQYAVDSHRVAKLLRDGGFPDPSDPDYNNNIDNGSTYRAHVDAIISRFQSTDLLDREARFEGMSIIQLSENLLFDVESELSDVREKASTQQLSLQAIERIYQDRTGVDLDQETMSIINFQRSYQATVKAIGFIDEMLQSLIEAI